MSNFYRAARARVKKGYLIPREIIEGLLEQKTIEDALAILKDTDYKRELLELQSPYKLAKIEQALIKNSVRHFYELIVTSGYSQILLAYFYRYPIHNLKIVLKGKALGKKYDELYDALVLDAEAYLGRRDIVIKALEMQSLEETVLQLSKYSLGKEVVTAYNAYKESKKIGVFDIFLDKTWINMLVEAWIEADTKDKEDTRDLIGLETDSYHILSILRAKYLGLDVSFQRELIAKKSFYIDVETLFNMIDESLESAIQILKGSYYKFLISEELKSPEDIDELEKRFLKQIFKTAQSKFIKNPISIGEALAYFKVKEMEVRNIMTILFGIENGLKPSRIQEMLFV